MSRREQSERDACQHDREAGGDGERLSYFSSSYEEARRRFREMATSVGMGLQTYPVEVHGGDDLTIDVAVLGRDADPAVVLSSGVHGVEGFLGSAVQLAFLDRLRREKQTPGLRYVLIHGVNPYGFAHLRRFNEDNVDLNRNFWDAGQEFSGAPADYVRLERFLNPGSPPARSEPFTLKVALKILAAGRDSLRQSAVEFEGGRAIKSTWRRGLEVLKRAVAGGQYEFPQGIFFGGKRPCRSTQLVQQNCDSWLGGSPTVQHYDFHTGLGKFGTYQLLLSDRSKSLHYAWFVDTFGAENVEPLVEAEGVAYSASGVFGDWMERRFADRDYRFVTPEFGTFPGIRVLGALRAENRAHHHCAAGDPRLDRAKKNLVECFCPSAPSWRRTVLRSSLEIIERGTRAVVEAKSHPTSAKI